MTGEPRRDVKVADSGARRIHAFCGTCGGPVYACDEHHPQWYALPVAALDEREALGRPARQIWTKRRLPWIPRLDGVPEVEGQP